MNEILTELKEITNNFILEADEFIEKYRDRRKNNDYSKSR